MTARAVHLEIAGDLSSDSFILSLRCFIARRGNVKNIRSDNGTNFIGAEKELEAAINEIDKEKVMTEIIKKGIHFSWKFNPPSSPWMGGAWESLIKSVKRSLKAITLDRIFTEEALYTFLCEVESLLNKRPVTPSSDDINDCEALTPNHLILGDSSSNNPPYKCQNDEIYYRKKWCAVQGAANMFSNQWRNEYLPTLIQRRKWYRNSKNLKFGDLVIIQSENIPLGRVIETYPGKNDIVRTVNVKTPNNKLIRPSRKLCLLENSYE